MSKIFWTVDENNRHAATIHLMHPDQNYLEARTIEDLQSLRLSDAVAAMKKAIPSKKRHRPLNTVYKIKAELLKSFARLRQDGLPPDLNVKPVKKAISAAVATTIEEMPADARTVKVFWKPFEYDLMVRDIHKRNPGARYIDSTTLAGLAPAEVRDSAKRVLPPGRQRLHIQTIASERKKFLEAFARLKVTLQAEAEEKRKADEERKVAEEANKQEAELAISTANETAAHIADVQAIIAVDHSLDAQIKRAMSMLGEVCADAFMGAFIGKLETTLRASLPAMLAAAMATAAPAAESAPTKPVLNHAPEAKQDKPNIGIIGLLPAQAQELERSFPQLRLTCVRKDLPNRQIKSAISSCDRVIGVTDFLSHPTDHAAKSAVGEKYKRVTGGVTAIRHQIEVWMKSGALQDVALHA